MKGNWKGLAKICFDPNEWGDKAIVQANMRLILGGRFLIIGYAGSMQWRPLEGWMIVEK